MTSMHNHTTTLITKGVRVFLIICALFAAPTPVVAGAQPAVLPSAFDSAAVLRATANYLKKSYGSRLVVTPGGLCVPGTHLCADDATVLARQHASALATGLPEATSATIKRTCKNNACSYLDINGAIIFETPHFTGSHASVPVRMSLQPPGAPASWYETGEVELDLRGGQWFVTSYRQETIS